MIRLTLTSDKSFYLNYSDIHVIKGTHYHTEIYHNVCGMVHCSTVKELPSRVMGIIKQAQDLERLND